MIKTGIGGSELISVIMPVYKGTPYLDGAIKSILGQTYQNFELIIISERDSPEETIFQIDSYDDKRIIHINNEKNLGLIESTNKAIKLSSGDFIARMDSDDYSHPTRLTKEHDYLLAHPKTYLVGSQINICDENDRIIGKTKYPTESYLLKWRLLFSNLMAHSSVMMRREFFNIVGLYEKPLSEDYDLWLKAAAQDEFEINNINETLVDYRIHQKSLTTNNVDKLNTIAQGLSDNAINNLMGASDPETNEILRGNKKIGKKDNLELIINYFEIILESYKIHHRCSTTQKGILTMDFSYILSKLFIHYEIYYHINKFELLNKFKNRALGFQFILLYNYFKFRGLER